jgi:protein-histidine N-methyltransferase
MAQNYGMKTNAELLLGYGFILPEIPDFHNDYVHIKTRASGDDDDLASTHLVSLRPISDPSSVVARARRLISPGVEVASAFSHFQDSLITSLYEAIRASSGAADGDGLSMDDLMTGRMPDEIRDKIIQVLGSKLSFDLDTLDEVEVPREDLNANQQLAVQYRDQCRRVLDDVLRCLVRESA